MLTISKWKRIAHPWEIRGAVHPHAMATGAISEPRHKPRPTSGQVTHVAGSYSTQDRPRARNTMVAWPMPHAKAYRDDALAIEPGDSEAATFRQCLQNDCHHRCTSTPWALSAGRKQHRRQTKHAPVLNRIKICEEACLALSPAWRCGIRDRASKAPVREGRAGEDHQRRAQPLYEQLVSELVHSLRQRRSNNESGVP